MAIMSIFTHKTITPHVRICLRLQQARDSRGISLDVIAQKTKINKNWLAALEECRFADIPAGPLYQKNYLKKYLEALDLDPASYLSQFATEEINSAKLELLPSPRRSYGRKYFNNLPNLFRFSLIGIFVISLLFYLGKQVKNTLEPPFLTLSSPVNGFIAQNNSITISGASEPEVRIAINGQPVMSDEVGRFNQPVTLSPGINTIIVTAQKKHGKTTEETRHIIYKENPKLSLGKQETMAE